MPSYFFGPYTFMKRVFVAMCICICVGVCVCVCVREKELRTSEGACAITPLLLAVCQYISLKLCELISHTETTLRMCVSVCQRGR